MCNAVELRQLVSGSKRANLNNGRIRNFYELLTNSTAGAFDERRVRIFRIGGWPNKRLYSRLNRLGLSYPTSNAALAAFRPSMSMRARADWSRICF
jgi:hypothetical protein